MAAIVSPGRQPPGVGALGRFADRIPELWHSDTEVGRCAAMSRATKMVTIEEERDEVRNTAYKLAAANEEDVFNALLDMRTISSRRKTNSRKISIIGDEIISHNMLAKMAACTLGRTGVRFTNRLPR